MGKVRDNNFNCNDNKLKTHNKVSFHLISKYVKEGTGITTFFAIL